MEVAWIQAGLKLNPVNGREQFLKIAVCGL